MTRNCMKCGAPVGESARFCKACGNPLEQSLVSAANAEKESLAPLPPETAAAAPPKSAKAGSPLRKIILIGLAFLVLIVMAAVSAAIYVGYLAKKKFEEVKNKVVQSVQTETAKTGNEANRRPETIVSNRASYPEWKPPSDSSQPFANGKIPFQPGLTVVTAIAYPLVGDYESIKRMEAVNDNGVRIAFSADLPSANASDLVGGEAKPASSTRRKTCVRTVQRQDMQNAHVYWQNFCIGGAEETYPGTTAISASTQVLAELKTKGEAALRYQSSALISGPPDASCTLKRVEPVDLAIPVLVNDQRIQLPAVHAKCQSELLDQADFYFLDDPGNPLSLAWQLGANRLQVVKITVPTATPQIEQSLSRTGRAEIYGIYFDFASATIRPESEPVLKEIAGALEKNPTWALEVEGHTDNIGSDAYNLELSKRRAEAVKQALVEQYHVSGNRLTTDGYGASRPKESNDTLEGRARNRRVELRRMVE